MSSNLAKAAVGALALNGGAENNAGVNNNNGNSHNHMNAENNVNAKHLVDENGNTGIFPDCPNPKLPRFHDADVCITKPHRPLKGHPERKSIYDRLKNSGTGATMVPNQQTIVCPLEVNTLENPSAQKGFDTTWIVENTSSVNVVISWVVDGVEWSPFDPDVKPMDDHKARLAPGEWQSVPTFESFVYNVREVMEDGTVGNVLLQHRAGLIPLGNPNKVDCNARNIDVEPVNPETAKVEPTFSRTPTHSKRPCNTIDVGFRNQAGCPLHVYWANRLDNVPTEGFTCGEKFKFHLGTKPAPQDFMFDWESQTKFEGSYIGHTFVARLASNPDVVVDSYTLESTKIVDCPNLKQQVAVGSQDHAEAIITAEGTVQPLDEQLPGAAAGGAVMADMGGASF